MGGRLVLALIAFSAIGLSFAGPGASAGPPECVDPSPDGGGHPDWVGVGTPNHTLVAKGDLCPGDTDIWTFETVDVPVDQFVGVRIGVMDGDVSAFVEVPGAILEPVEPGIDYHSGAGQVAVTFHVRITGEGPGLARYRVQMCRGIYDPCQFARVDNPPPGDADCDGAVDAFDAYYMLVFAASLSGPPECADVADVDGDGRLTPRDALLILQYEAGLIDELPVP